MGPTARRAYQPSHSKRRNTFWTLLFFIERAGASPHQMWPGSGAANRCFALSPFRGRWLLHLKPGLHRGVRELFP
jgi:hypothetical protein